MARKIYDLILEFQDIFDTLDISVSLLEVERLVVTIHHIMERNARQFHTLDHVLGLAMVADPVQSLAALFHDTVYYQVDGAIPSEVSALIGEYIRVTDGMVYVADGIAAEQRPFHITLSLFDYEEGQQLSFHEGLNEFLSALFVYQRLADIVPEAVLVQVVTCIEATIPFRSSTHFVRLADRLTAVNQKYQLNLTPEEMTTCLQTAVQFSNSDVAGFGEPATAIFLNGTWKLLPETNFALRNGGIYSIRDYRIALQKMHRFFSQLTPKRIFHQYANIPAPSEYETMLSNAQRNLTEGVAYLGVKLVAIALIEALAELSGGDAPLSLFMGEMLEDGEVGERLEDQLPFIDLSDMVDDPILHLLVFGRVGDIKFDIRHSPLATYLYVSVGAEKTVALLTKAEAMFNGALPPAEFLWGFDKEVVTAVAQATAYPAITRREVLRALPNKLYTQ